jgi:hypothetical protein
VHCSVDLDYDKPSFCGILARRSLDQGIRFKVRIWFPDDALRNPALSAKRSSVSAISFITLT